MAVFFSEIEDTITATAVIDKVKIDYGNENLRVIGNSSLYSDAVTISEFLVETLRKYDLHRNVREMVLNTEDQMIALQLSLAFKQKEEIGDFDVAVSTVLETNQWLTKKRLEDMTSEENLITDCELDERMKNYCSFLRENNFTDLMEVTSRIWKEIKVNESLKLELEQTNLIFLAFKPHNTVEEKMLDLLTADKPIYTVQTEIPLDASFNEDAKIDISFTQTTLTEIMEKTKENNSFSFTPRTPASKRTMNSSFTPTNSQMSQKTPSHRTPKSGPSVTELYLEGVFVSYLHLIVNTRSELALAKVINIPDRELHHEAFTDLKRYAKDKKLSMYQAAVSYVMNLRIGGKSLLQGRDDLISKHGKGLSEFIDLCFKIQVILENDSDPSGAITRAINVIKNAILKSRDNKIRRESVEKVVEKLKTHAVKVKEQIMKRKSTSPKQEISAGGSLIGRHNFKIIRSILDHFSGQNATYNPVNYLTDTVSSQATPIRFQCVLSKFRSPIECSPESELTQSLANRVKGRLGQSENQFQGIPRYQAGYDWAMPQHSVGFSNEKELSPITSQHVMIRSKTLVHPKSSHGARRVLETINDQENVDAITISTTEVQTVGEPCNKKRKLANKPIENSGDLSRKNNVTGKAKQAEKSQKARPQKPSKAKRNKLLPVQGQRQITNFFRM